MGSLSVLQGIVPTQALNSGLPHCGLILYQLSYKGSLRILEWVAYPFSSVSSQPRNRTRVSCTAGGFFTNSPPGKPKNTGVGSLSLLQWVSPTQESNLGLQCSSVSMTKITVSRQRIFEFFSSHIFWFTRIYTQHQPRHSDLTPHREPICYGGKEFHTVV